MYIYVYIELRKGSHIHTLQSAWPMLPTDVTLWYHFIDRLMDKIEMLAEKWKRWVWGVQLPSIKVSESMHQSIRADQHSVSGIISLVTHTVARTDSKTAGSLLLRILVSKWLKHTAQVLTVNQLILSLGQHLWSHSVKIVKCSHAVHNLHIHFLTSETWRLLIKKYLWCYTFNVK